MCPEILPEGCHCCISEAWPKRIRLYCKADERGKYQQVIADLTSVPAALTPVVSDVIRYVPIPKLYPPQIICAPAENTFSFWLITAETEPSYSVQFQMNCRFPVKGETSKHAEFKKPAESPRGLPKTEKKQNRKKEKEKEKRKKEKQKRKKEKEKQKKSKKK